MLSPPPPPRRSTTRSAAVSTAWKPISTCPLDGAQLDADTGTATGAPESTRLGAGAIPWRRPGSDSPMGSTGGGSVAPRPSASRQRWHP